MEINAGTIFIFLGFSTGFPYTMTDLQQIFLTLGVHAALPFFQHLSYLFSTPIEFIKIYIGQLPLDFQEDELIRILEPMAELKEVKVIKGDNTRGKFDMFCYAFVTMRGNQSFGHQIIRRLHEQFPTWKMNVKFDLDRKRMPMNKIYPNQPMPYQRQNMPYQNYAPMPRAPYQNYQNPHHQSNVGMNNPISSSEKVLGKKPCNILVRELWLGGIPEHYDKTAMAQLMSCYGIIEEIQIFPKFAFIKFKKVPEATTAFQRAQEIAHRLGNPPGFRIFFSDPSRRAYVVSNNYEFEKQSIHVPVVFIGFPPITSATVEMQVIKPVVEKIAPVTAEYMRKNTNSQNRSYFLFSFDSVKTSIRVKQELNRRKDLLGDKRAEVAVLMDQQHILKGRDLSHTEKMFQSDDGMNKNRKYMNYNNVDPNMKHGMMPPMHMPYPPMYQNPMYPMHPYPSYYPPPQPYYYQPGYYKSPEEGEPYHQNPQPIENISDNDNFHDFLKDVLAVDKDIGNEKKPVKSTQLGNQEDILSKLLGSEAKVKQDKSEDQPQKHQKVKEKSEQREPSWSGFLTWKGMKRVGVDGHSNKTEPEDYAINIVSLIQFKDAVFKDKNVMILEPSNNIGKLIFKDYIKQLRNKVGVAFNTQFLMYVMAKSPEADQISPIEDDQLLVILEKASFLTLIKDKLIKSEELA